MKKTIAIMLAVLLTLVSCSMENDSKAVISFNVDEAEARGVEPVDMSTAYYIVEGSGPATFDSGHINVDQPSGASYEIVPGSWTFTAYAYNDDNQKIGQSDSVTKTVSAGPNAPISLTVREVSGSGSVTFNIQYENTEDPDTLLYVQIDGGEKEVLAKEGNLHTLTLSLSNGFHEVALYEGNETSPAEVFSIRVVTGYDTMVDIEHKPSSFGYGYFDITGDITDTPEIKLTSSISVSNIPLNIGFTVSSSVEGLSGNLSYQWFLNGVQIPDATESTLVITSLEDLASQMASSGTIGEGTELSLVLRVSNGTISWTSDALKFTAAAKVDFPTVSVTDEERRYGYDAGTQTVEVSTSGTTEGFTFTYFVDGTEITGNANSISIDPSAYSVGSHKVTYSISSSTYGFSITGDLFTFTVVPSVSLILDNTEDLHNYDFLTGTVTLAPEGDYKVDIYAGGYRVDYVTIADGTNGSFSAPLGVIETTGDYDVRAVAYTSDGKTQLAESEAQSIKIQVPEVSITSDYAKVYQGESLFVETNYYGSTYQWEINGDVLEGYSSLNVSDIAWPPREYTIQLTVDGKESNPLTIEVLERPNVSVLVNGKDDVDDWKVGDPVTFSISNPDNKELSNIRWEVYAEGSPVEDDFNDKTSITIKETTGYGYSVNLYLDVDDVAYSAYGSVYDDSYNGSYDDNFQVSVDKLVVNPDDGVVNVSYKVGNYLYGTEITTAVLQLYKEDAAGQTTSGDPITIAVPSEGIQEFTLTEEGTYSVALELKDQWDNIQNKYFTSYIHVTTDGIIPITAQDVFQTIVLETGENSDKSASAAAATGTIIIDWDKEEFAYYYVQFTDEILDAMTSEEGVTETENPMIVDAGSVERSGNTITLKGSETYTLTPDGDVYKDTNGHEWKKLNTSTRAIGDFAGKWTLPEIRLDAGFLNKVYEIALGYLNEMDPQRPWDQIVTFDSDESVGVNAGLEISQGGLFKIGASVDLDFSALNTESTSVSLADDIELAGQLSGELESYGKDDMLRVAGKAYELAIQKSEDGSVLILYILYSSDTGYGVMSALPLTKTDSIPVTSVGDQAFDETLEFTMTDLVDAAIDAETKLGADGTALLYDLFAPTGSEFDFSFLKENAIWDLTVQSGDENFQAIIQELFGDSIVSLMGSLELASGEYLSNIQEYDPDKEVDGRPVNWSIDLDDGGTVYLNITENTDGSLKVDVIYEGLPTTYSGTIALAKRQNVKFTDLLKEVMEYSMSSFDFSIELRNDGEVWAFFAGDGMHVCNYSIADGKITVMTEPDLIPELEGLSVLFGGVLPYEEVDGGIRINVLEDQSKSPIGVVLRPQA